MFSKILIANRGEIAVRVIKTCRRLGIATVVVYSDADAGSLAVEMADETVHIGPSPANQSYLVADKIIAACKQTGAEAVHPGFGFLSENAGFAQRCADEGIAFIGPNPGAISAMGDKIESKKFAQAAGVSCVPGHIGEIDDTAHAVKISEQIGYPVMIKAVGRRRRQGHPRRLEPQGRRGGLPGRARRGQGQLRRRPDLHREVHREPAPHRDPGAGRQARQRRPPVRARMLDPAPQSEGHRGGPVSPLLDEATRAAMGAQAVALAKAVNYDSAGTVEFVAGQDKSFFFLEMNTRLQVEHPVTELITGLDLVEQMIRRPPARRWPFGRRT
jgi:propionyl-CoA carboxylase alpha chain